MKVQFKDNETLYWAVKDGDWKEKDFQTTNAATGSSDDNDDHRL